MEPKTSPTHAFTNRVLYTPSHPSLQWKEDCQWVNHDCRPTDLSTPNVTSPLCLPPLHSDLFPTLLVRTHAPRDSTYDLHTQQNQLLHFSTQYTWSSFLTLPSSHSCTFPAASHTLIPAFMLLTSIFSSSLTLLYWFLQHLTLPTSSKICYSNP